MGSTEAHIVAEPKCLLCGSTPLSRLISNDQIDVECGTCGEYRVSGTVAALIATNPSALRLKPYLSAYTRQTSDRGTGAVIGHDWQTLAARHQTTAIPEKLDRLLRYYAGAAPTPGSTFVRHSAHADYPLFDAFDVEEVEYLGTVLAEEGLITARDDDWTLTPKGWASLSPVSPGGTPGTCFVAMAFDPSMDEAYESGIKPSVSATGLTVIRVDKVEHNGVVTDLIMAEIRRAQVTVADVTLHRNGVYFEAGFALGLGRVVVWTCREDEMSKAHFDTRQYSHVVWRDPADLAIKLEARLRATVAIPVR
jgi:hypothetical protein